MELGFANIPKQSETKGKYCTQKFFPAKVFLLRTYFLMKQSGKTLTNKDNYVRFWAEGGIKSAKNCLSISTCFARFMLQNSQIWLESLPNIDLLSQSDTTNTLVRQLTSLL